MKQAVEGIVLLKNENNTLPLTEQDKVSVFGRPMIEYYRSGTGSGGAVNVEYTTNILDGFENSNLNFNKTIVEDYKEWLKDHPFDNGGRWLGMRAMVPERYGNHSRLCKETGRIN